MRLSGVEVKFVRWDAMYMPLQRQGWLRHDIVPLLYAAKEAPECPRQYINRVISLSLR